MGKVWNIHLPFILLVWFDFHIQFYFCCKCLEFYFYRNMTLLFFFDPWCSKYEPVINNFKSISGKKEKDDITLHFLAKSFFSIFLMTLLYLDRHLAFVINLGNVNNFSLSLSSVMIYAPSASDILKLFLPGNSKIR